MLRAVSFALFVCYAIIILAQTPQIETSHGPEKSSENRLTKTLIAPLQSVQSVLSQRAAERSESPQTVISNDLPGFGNSSYTPAAPTMENNLRSSQSPQFSQSNNFSSQGYPGGSLSLNAPAPQPVPSIYIEGQGYLPITHPSIASHVDPSRIVTSQTSQADPTFLVASGHMSPYMPPSPSAFPEATRIYETSNTTTLSYAKIDDIEPIIVASKTGWVKVTEQNEIYFLEGDCSVRQGKNSVQGPQAVVWIDKKKDILTGSREVIVYMESDNSKAPLCLELDPEKVGEARIFDQKWLGRFKTVTSVQTLIMEPNKIGADIVSSSDGSVDNGVNIQEPAIYQRAKSLLAPSSEIVQMQYVSQPVSAASGAVPIASAPSAPPRFRQYLLSPRGDNYFDLTSEPYPHNPERGIVVISKGVNLVIEGIADDNRMIGDIVDISADHVVIWMANPGKFRGGIKFKEESNQDFEVYLEGNIEFRDGSKTIEASRMYYDAKNKIAYVLDGRLSAPIEGVKNIKGTLHLRAEILQKIGDGLFTAKNTLVTTSRLGEPSYSLRSRTLTLSEQMVGQRFGDTEPTKRQILVAENNYLAMRNVPVLYWPWMAADLKDPTFYIKNISYGNSDVYGHQIRTKWNPFQILNVRNKPDWLDGDVSLSWLEKRGFGHGANFSFSPDSCFGCAGKTDSEIDFWGIKDRGLDRLGGNRSAVSYPHEYRYHVGWKHRQTLSSLWNWDGPWTLTAEVGKTSDRNFLNHYFNSSWNSSDNDTTSIELKKNCGNSSLSLFSEYALDKFYSNANWLPRLDHYKLGESLLGDRLTWYGHTRVGYMKYHTASSPSDWDQDGKFFRYLPWELQAGGTTSKPTNPEGESAKTIGYSGEVFSTRHELDLPFNVGPVRCVPYVLGDFSHWGKDRTGQDVQRFYGQTGVRFNLPLWQVKPNCSSRTWYVNGLAHKVDLDAEFSYARADHNMENLIMTDSLDNWSIEDFRRRYSVTTFDLTDGTLPKAFDPRYYAFRSGMAGNVSAGNMEIADDLTLCRIGMTHRWQTKRGPLGRRHIINWITFSTHFNLYPEKEQNNGETVGLVDYDFLWHVGDRFSIFSSGLYDAFSDGQKMTRVGGVWNRPGRGGFSVALDDLQGVIKRTYLTLSFNYNMNEKYSMSYATSYDIKNNWENVGHNFMFVRTGEAFRLLVGATYSDARKDWSFSLGLEPVFLYSLATKVSNMSTTMNNR